MKISLISFPALQQGKQNVKDTRLDQVDKFVNAKKKTYVQVELVGEESALLADAILAPKESAMDLVLKDLEFVETRLSRSDSEAEKALLNKMKAALEKEEFLSKLTFSDEEKALMSSYGLHTLKPVVLAAQEEAENLPELLGRVLREAGFISFFTAGEKETRAWLIKKGTTAHEAAGEIHTDIQKGFIRAEIISFTDYIACGGETAAKQAGKLRLEQKNYIMQDCDLTTFRFNK